MNMGTTTTVQRDDAAECRAAKHVPQDTLREVREALARAERKLIAYYGVCKDDKELPKVAAMANAALATLDRVIEGAEKK
jgi:hypothetical protein